ETLTTLVEDRDDAALSRDVKPTEDFIKREYVRVCADRVNGSHFLCVQIKQGQLCIVLTGNECQTMLAVDVESVASAATGQGITSDDLICFRIDLGEFILSMHGDKDVLRDGIVLRVSCASSKGNRCQHSIGFGVNNRVCLSMQI